MSNRKTLGGALYTAIPALLLNVLGVPVTALIIRQLGKVQYGQWVTATALTALIASLLSFGYRPLFIRRVADNSLDVARETAHQIGLRTGIGILILVLGTTISLILGYPRTVVICTLLAGLGTLMTSFSSALVDVLQGNQNMKVLAGVNFLSGILLTVLSLIVVLTGGDVIFVSISYLSGPLLSLILLLLIINKNYFKVSFLWDISLFKKRFDESRFVGVSTIFATFRDRMETILIPTLIGIPAYGVFSASAIFSDRLNIIQSSLGDSFFSPIAKAANEEPEKVSSHVGNLILAEIMVCFPVAMVIIFLSDLLASFLMPLNIHECTLMIQITILSLPVSALLGAMGIALQATKAHNEGAKASLWATLASVILSVLLIFKYGIIGAAVSQVCRPLIGCIAYYHFFNFRFNGVFGKYITFRLFLSFFAMGSFLWLGKKIFTPAIGHILHVSPWVARKLGVISTRQDMFESVQTVSLMCLWVLLSVIIFGIVALLLRVISSESLLGVLKTRLRKEGK
jgi:O-antigen/teichoic acid export membrane protein